MEFQYLQAGEALIQWSSIVCVLIPFGHLVEIAILIQEYASRSYDILASSNQNDSVVSSVPIEIVRSFPEGLNPGAQKLAPRISLAVQPDFSDS